MKIIISIGGSLLYTGKDFDYDYAKRFSGFAKKLSEEHKIVIVTGGGRLARKIIGIARKGGVANEFFCDSLGIDATKINARLLSAIIGLKETNIRIPENFSDVYEELEKKNIVVMGGTYPGHSTDAVSALVCEYIDGNLLINASNVDGIYDKDPNKSSDAKMLKKIKIEKLINMIKDYSIAAGKYELFDIVAAKIIERSKIKTILLNGKDLVNFEAAIKGKGFLGTTIE